MDTVEIMSNHSAPYLTRSLELTPASPHEYRRERSYTLPRNRKMYENRSVKLPSTSYSDVAPGNICKPRLSVTSSDGSIHEPETMEEKWKKLKEMMVAVESMRSVVDCLFPAVEAPEYSDSPIDYSSSSEYEIEVQLLRRNIDEQISRMKAYWSDHRPRTNNDRYQLEEMRFNIESNFKRMKVVVEGLIPSVNGLDFTKCRIEQIRNQISDIEDTVKQLAESRRSEEQPQRPRSKHVHMDETPMNFQSLTTSIRADCNDSRIQELEEELAASLEREEALRARIRKLEIGNDKEVAKVEEQRQQLCQLLDKAHLRAKQAKDDALELKSQVDSLSEGIMTKQYELNYSKRNISELENKIADMRASESRTQLRNPPDAFLSYKASDIGYGSNANSVTEQAPAIQKVTSPRTVHRERNFSTTSQRSNVGSPRERMQVPFTQRPPVMSYMQTKKEYSRVSNNTQPQRYMVMA